KPTGKIRVCTPNGCDAPYKVDFGGSRVGVTTSELITIKNVGDAVLNVRNLAILNQQSEFTTDPTGDVNMPLDPQGEMAVKVNLTERDGIADNEMLQIVSDADESRVLVSLVSEYKGVPQLVVTTQPAPNTPDTLEVDFGSVRAGMPKTIPLFI